MTEPTTELATLANGCFWCTEAVFLRLKGVLTVQSGYTAGHVKNPAYREVCAGTTGHAEAIQIEFDPTVISFNELLEVFFATHDPTTLNRQGHDVGTQYRSGIFYHSEEQKDQAEAMINFLDKEKVFDSFIVTEVTKADVFYNAEAVHDQYYDRNTEQGYCQIVINPKIDKLNKYFNEKLK